MFLLISALYISNLWVSRDISKAIPENDMQVWGGDEVLLYSFLTSALNGGKRPDSSPGRFTAAKRVARERAPWNRPRRGGVNYNSTFSLTSTLDEDGWSTPGPNRFTPGNEPVPTVYEAEWAPGPVRRVRKISAPLKFDPRTVPESLYQLRYPGSRISPPMASYVTQGNTNAKSTTILPGRHFIPRVVLQCTDDAAGAVGLRWSCRANELLGHNSELGLQ